MVDVFLAGSNRKKAYKYTSDAGKIPPAFEIYELSWKRKLALIH
jgi:hypothetical protein